MPWSTPIILILRTFAHDYRKAALVTFQNDGVSGWKFPWPETDRQPEQQTRAEYGCFVAGQGPVAAGLTYMASAYRLYARSVCDTTAPQRLQLPLVALYAFTFFTFYYYQPTIAIVSNSLASMQMT